MRLPYSSLTEVQTCTHLNDVISEMQKRKAGMLEIWQSYTRTFIRTLGFVTNGE